MSPPKVASKRQSTDAAPSLNKRPCHESACAEHLSDKHQRQDIDGDSNPGSNVEPHLDNREDPGGIDDIPTNQNQELDPDTSPSPSAPAATSSSLFSPPATLRKLSSTNMGQASTSLGSWPTPAPSPAESLRPNQCVSSDAINTILTTFNPDPSTIHVLDSVYVDTSDPQRNFAKLFTQPPNTSLLIVPLRHKTVKPNHWTLGLVDLTNTHIEHYDPLQMEAVADLAADALRNLMAADPRTGWTISRPVSDPVIFGRGRIADTALQQHAHKQDGTADCGVHILAYALYAMLHRPQPDRLHIPAWRAFFATSIDNEELTIHHESSHLAPPPATDFDSLPLAQIKDHLQNMSFTQAWCAELTVQIELVQLVMTSHQRLAADLSRLDEDLKHFGFKDQFKKHTKIYQDIVEKERSLQLQRAHLTTALHNTAPSTTTLQALAKCLEGSCHVLGGYVQENKDIRTRVKNHMSQIESLLAGFA